MQKAIPGEPTCKRQCINEEPPEETQTSDPSTKDKGRHPLTFKPPTQKIRSGPKRANPSCHAKKQIFHRATCGPTALESNKPTHRKPCFHVNPNCY